MIDFTGACSGVDLRWRFTNSNRVAVFKPTLWVAAISIILAIACVFYNLVFLPYGLMNEYYDLLLWGGGHIMQCTETILMILA